MSGLIREVRRMRLGPEDRLLVSISQPVADPVRDRVQKTVAEWAGINPDRVLVVWEGTDLRALGPVDVERHMREFDEQMDRIIEAAAARNPPPDPLPSYEGRLPHGRDPHLISWEDGSETRSAEIVDANGLRWTRVLWINTRTGEGERNVPNAATGKLQLDGRGEVYRERFKAAVPLNVKWGK